jgi:hypothetical protein
MPDARRFLRFAVFLGLCALALGSAQSAFAAESCTYDPGTKAVTASIDAGSAATLKLVAGEIWFGFSPAPCGTATSANTDSIAIAGASGSNETLVLDERGGVFGPGAMSEYNLPEIEISTTLGDGTDQVVLYATDADDVLAAGQFGVALNSDGDVDVTFAPTAFKLGSTASRATTTSTRAARTARACTSSARWSSTEARATSSCTEHGAGQALRRARRRQHQRSGGGRPDRGERGQRPAERRRGQRRSERRERLG